MHALTSRHGFGLIGIMIAMFIILAIVFGFQKLQPEESSPTDDTSLGTYQPITPANISGQLEAGQQAKESAETTVKNLQDRVAHDVSGNGE